MTNNSSPRHLPPIRTKTDPNIRVNDFAGLTPPQSAQRGISPGHSPNPFPQFEVDPEAERLPGLPSPPLSPETLPLSPRILPSGSANGRKKRPETIGKRLKARGGLNLYMNDPNLRQYKDYDNLGTPHSPFFSPGPWTANSNAFGEPNIQTSLERYEDAIAEPLSILDVFSTSTFREVLKDPATVARLRHFAEASGSTKDIDILLQIAEFNKGVNQVASTVSSISQRFIGVAASSPVRFPLSVSRNLNGNIRDVAGSLLPSLECLFDDAKGFVEQSLAQDIYPEFLKHQLSLSLQTVGSFYPPSQVCPGFGEAFCMTDPRETSNPMVYVSTGLSNLTGYSHAEMVFKDCRMFQGPGTRGSCADRLRHGLSKKDEFTELILNYTRDGRLFWNLVFAARLVGPDGETQYHLGGQIDVTEMLERHEDISHVLGYIPSIPEPPTEATPEQDRMESWRGSPREKKQDREREAQAKYPPSVSRNKFLRPFRRRLSQIDFSGGSGTESANDLSASEPSTPMGSRRSMSFSTPPIPSLHTVVSPYSRFMVLEYIKPSRTEGRHDKKTGRAQLPLAFCSASTFESFGTGSHTLASVAGQNVFDVLSEKARSPSITRAFKSTVRASLAEGRTAKVDITLGGNNHTRPRGLSLSRKPSSGALSTMASETSSDHARLSRRSFSLERLGPSESNTAGKFVSYWTPLKNDLGATQWVVVVFVPEVMWHR